MIEEGDKETDGCTYTIYGTRLETDGEYKKRIKTDQDIILWKIGNLKKNKKIMNELLVMW